MIRHGVAVLTQRTHATVDVDQQTTGCRPTHRSPPRSPVGSRRWSRCRLGSSRLRCLDSNVTLVTAIGSAFIDRFAGSLKDLAVAIVRHQRQGRADRRHRRRVDPVGRGARGRSRDDGCRPRRSGSLLPGLIGAWLLATDPQGSATVAMVAGVAAIGAGLVAFFSCGGSPRPGDLESMPTAPVTDRVDVVGPAAVAAVASVVLGAVVAIALGVSGPGAAVDRDRIESVLPEPVRSTPVPAECDRRRARGHPVHHVESRLLPDRHGAGHAPGRRRRLVAVGASAWSTSRCRSRSTSCWRWTASKRP